MKYVLITPAFNEEEHLPGLIDSVLQQTIRPVCWVIVNDGSSDRTKEIINDAAKKYEFIQTVHLSREENTEYYARKIHVFNRGYDFLSKLSVDYEIIGNLDADLTFGPNFYVGLLEEYQKNTSLGVAGGMYRYPDNNTKVLWGGNYVPGSMLTARRECFEQVQGYRPLKYGCEDTLLCIMAEKQGWEVNYFPQYEAIQHRVVGTSNGMGILNARFRQGRGDYNIGYHPLFVFSKILKRSVEEPPFFIGSLMRLSGYVYAWCSQEREYVDEDVVAYLRQNQLKRLRLF